jgi:hypothetical protein
MIRLFSKGVTAASCKVTILVHSVTVHSNGKAPGLPGEVVTGHNTLTAAMMYPRGGYPQLTAVLQVELQNNVPRNFDTAGFYGPNHDGTDAPGLFKTEQIDGEAPLTIQVTTSADAGAVTRGMKRLFGGLLTTAAALFPGGPLVAAATESFAGPISDHLSSASGNELQVIGRATLLLKTADLLRGDNPWIVTLPLIATATIHDKWQVMTSASGGEANYKTVEGDLTTAGQPNGSITLSITTSAL